MQPDDVLGGLERGERGLGVAVDEAVGIGAGEHHHQGTVWVGGGKAGDGLGAAPGMQPLHQVGRLVVVVGGYAHPLAEPARIAAQRLAVARVPAREPRGAGVIRRMRV